MPIFVLQLGIKSVGGYIMKRCLIFVSILALTACTTDSGSGGGGNGGSYNHSVIGNGTSSGSMTGGSGTGGNTGGNTNGGNTNNQQNNQVTHYTNFKQYFDNVIGNNNMYFDLVQNNQSWPSQGGYKHYEYKYHSSTGTTHSIYHAYVDEKEMQLANYGVQNSRIRHEFDEDYSNTNAASAYIHNREGVGANLYTPQENTIFTGGTLAYLDASGTQPDRIIKGNATFTYNSEHPELLLNYDNYYTINIVKGDGKSETTTVSGTNNTGDAYYNITPGSYTDSYGYDARFTAEHLKKGSIEETVGTYTIDCGNGGVGGSTTNDFYITGAFGGTKQ